MKTYRRVDRRSPGELRPVKIIRNYLKFPSGSVLIEMGDTRVVCTAYVDETVPAHRRGTGGGWITAEYGMLPMSTQQRKPREVFGKIKGRTQEIQRLIGRSLRGVVNLSKLGERTIYIDADVLQADGGTRTASINGAFVALADAVDKLIKQGIILDNPINENLAAVSVGVVNNCFLLDLNYDEDSRAEVDLNVVMTESGRFIEIQGTAENEPFSKKDLDEMLTLAERGVSQLIKKASEVLKK